MAVRKIYEAIEFKDLDTYEVVNGVRTPIQFRSSSPALEAKGKYVSSNPEIIKAMDASIARGKCAYKCILTENFYNDDEPLPDIPDGTKDSAEQTDGDDIRQVPDIKTIQDARAYLNKEFEIPLSKMPNGGAVKKAAAEHKVSFPDLA